MGLDPTTPHSLVLLIDPAAFEGSNESSIWYDHTEGFHHYPQQVTGPPDPTPVFDPTVFGPIGGWLAQAIVDGRISVADRPAEHLWVAVVLIFAPRCWGGLQLSGGRDLTVRRSGSVEVTQHLSRLLISGEEQLDGELGDGDI